MVKGKRKVVSFVAKRTVTKPVRVNFKTSYGKKVSFIAKKKVTKPVKIRFKSKI